MTDTNNDNTRHLLMAVWRFFIEAVAGILFFLIILIPAVGLNKLVHYLEKDNINIIIVTGIIHAEYILFIADLIIFLRFIWQSTFRLVKKL
ncbi:MAG: hypothetical protein H7839_03990 [Magnetococcus sp. YQC-5]